MRFSSRSAAATAPASSVSRGRRRGRQPCGSSNRDQLLVLCGDRVAPARDRPQRLFPAGRRSPAGCSAAVFGKVGAAEERHLVGRQEHRQRPAAGALRQHLVRGLVDLVDVGPLLAIDLDVHEMAIHHLPRSPGPRTTRAPSRDTSGTPSSRPTAGSACPARAQRAAPLRPTDTNRPGCPRAAADRGWSLARVDWAWRRDRATASVKRGRAQHCIMDVPLQVVGCACTSRKTLSRYGVDWIEIASRH